MGRKLFNKRRGTPSGVGGLIFDYREFQKEMTDKRNDPQKSTRINFTRTKDIQIEIPMVVGRQ